MIELDLNVIVQGASICVLAGVGKAVWSASLALAKLGAAFDAHTKSDEANFERISQDVKDAAEVARAALYHRDGKP